MRQKIYSRKTNTLIGNIPEQQRYIKPKQNVERRQNNRNRAINPHSIKETSTSKEKVNSLFNYSEFKMANKYEHGTITLERAKSTK